MCEVYQQNELIRIVKFNFNDLNYLILGSGQWNSKKIDVHGFAWRFVLVSCDSLNGWPILWFLFFYCLVNCLIRTLALHAWINIWRELVNLSRLVRGNVGVHTYHRKGLPFLLLANLAHVWCLILVHKLAADVD